MLDFSDQTQTQTLRVVARYLAAYVKGILFFVADKPKVKLMQVL